MLLSQQLYHICFHRCKRYPTASALRFLAIQRTQRHQLIAQARGPTTCCEVLLQFSTQRFLCGFNLVVFFIPIHYCHVPRLVQSYVTITSAANLGGVHSLHCYVLKPQNQRDWVVAHLPFRCRLFACLFACLLARRKLRFRDANSPNEGARERACFCLRPSGHLLSAFYKTFPFKNPAKNLVITGKPCRRLLRTL